MILYYVLYTGPVYLSNDTCSSQSCNTYLKMFYKIFALLACLIAVSGKSDPHKKETKLKATPTQKCKSITAADVRNLFKKWADSLLVGPEEVITNYWKTSILIPTLSNVVRDDPQSKIEYFEHFCAKKPVATIVEDYIDLTACNEAQYNGLYDFALTDPGTGAQSVAHARFSYTFQTFDGNEWKIMTHHSSLLPNPVGGARRLRSETENFEEVLNFNVASYD